MRSDIPVFEFRVPVDVSVLTERRVIAPYGMCCGDPGSVRQNLWVRVKGNEQKAISLGGKNTCRMEAGDRIIISESPLIPLEPFLHVSSAQSDCYL